MVVCWMNKEIASSAAAVFHKEVHTCQRKVRRRSHPSLWYSASISAILVLSSSLRSIGSDELVREEAAVDSVIEPVDDMRVCACGGCPSLGWPSLGVSMTSQRPRRLRPAVGLNRCGVPSMTRRLFLWGSGLRHFQGFEVPLDGAMVC